MSNVEKIVNKVHTPESGYGCNEYAEVWGEESVGAPYCVVWIVVDGIKYYLVDIFVDVNPGNAHLGWLPIDFVPDIGDRLVLSYDRAVEFSYFRLADKLEAFDIASNDVINGHKKITESLKFIRR